MSAIKYTDHGLTCDHKDCPVSIWGSHMELRDGMTLAHVRRAAAKRGWVTVRYRRKMDQYALTVLDFCPDHSGDAEQYLPKG